MNVRGTSMCLLCAGALFVACGSKSGKTAEVAGQADTVHVVGGDKDKHGCIASAGYTWSEVQKDKEGFRGFKLGGCRNDRPL